MAYFHNLITLLANGDIPDSGGLLDDISNIFSENKLNPWSSNPVGIDSVEGIIQWGVTIAAGLAGIVALFILIRHGGYEYIIAAGNPEQTKKAIAAITQSVIGLVLILASYLIIMLVLKTLGAN